MRIAIPLDGDQVADHMGHCPEYLIAEVKDNVISATTAVKNPRHGPGGPPPIFLATLGVTHLVGWGAPDHFYGFMNQLGIKYVTGAKGVAKEVLDQFVAGTLVTSTDKIHMTCNHDH